MVVKVEGFLGPTGFCYYCGREMTSEPVVPGTTYPITRRTKDHIIPKSKGGACGPTVWACAGCNEERSALTMDEYRVVIAFRNGLIPCPSYQFAAERVSA